MAENKSIPERLNESLKLINELNRDSYCTGYFLMTTLKTDNNKSSGLMYAYDSDDYVNLLGMLEPLVLEIKQLLLTRMQPSEPDSIKEQTIDKINSILQTSKKLN